MTIKELVEAVVALPLSHREIFIVELQHRVCLHCGVHRATDHPLGCHCLDDE